MAEELDPRFNPIFQRGYKGGGGGAQVNAAARPEDGHPALAAFADFVGLPPQHDPAEPWVEHAEVSEVSTEFVGDHFGFDKAQPAREPVWNPFIIILWVLGPALAGLGAWTGLGQYSQQFSPGGMTRPEYEVLLATLYLAENALVVGAGIIFGLLFWHAASYRRRALRRARK